jgi:diguanylate cyclase (GGDEF)-like protein
MVWCSCRIKLRQQDETAMRARAKTLPNHDDDERAAPDAAAELAALRSIVEDLDYGIVVLDAARRVRFVNRAFRSFWNVPDAIAAGQPTFVKLMYHGRGSAYTVAQHRLGEYLAQQLEAIRSGDGAPVNIRLTSGATIQFRCKALPDGGRLLTYGNVSDLVRQAEALELLATTDAMTGLANRRQFFKLAAVEWSRAERYQRPLALLMMDIDLFKSVNDTYGHLAGDEVIKAVAKSLIKHKRGSDVAARMGGEEFALLLPEASAEAAVAAGERLRKLVAEQIIVVEGKRIPVTISIGASACAADMRTVEDLLNEADIALYAAKRGGRNRVCRYDPAPALQAEHA